MGHVLLIALAWLAASATAHAWPGTQAHPGIWFEHRSGEQDYGLGASPQEVFVLYVDTSTPSLSFVASMPEDRGMTTSEFAQTYGLKAAVNANFGTNSDNGFHPCGMMMGQSSLWFDAYQSLPVSKCSDSVVFGPGAAVGMVDTWGSPTGPVPPGATQVVSGMPSLVLDGVARDESDLVTDEYPAHLAEPQPRTAICMHQDLTTLIMAVVDGREEGVRTGMPAAELALLMESLGCTWAVSLCGGAISAMYVEGQPGFPGWPDGVVNRTSAGKELPTCCHIGVGYGAPVVEDAGVDWHPRDAGTPETGSEDAVDATDGWEEEAAPPNAKPRAEDEEGCGCRLVAGKSSPQSPWAISLYAAVLTLHWRRAGDRA